MKIELTPKEIVLLKNKDIFVDILKDYTVDDVLDILDQVRDIEVNYSQGEDEQSNFLYNEYSAIANKIYNTIPEN